MKVHLLPAIPMGFDGDSGKKNDWLLWLSIESRNPRPKPVLTASTAPLYPNHREMLDFRAYEPKRQPLPNSRISLNPLRSGISVCLEYPVLILPVARRSGQWVQSQLFAEYNPSPYCPCHAPCISHGLGNTSLTFLALDSEFVVSVADTVVSRKGVGAAKSVLLCAKVAPRAFLCVL